MKEIIEMNKNLGMKITGFFLDAGTNDAFLSDVGFGDDK